MSRCLCCGKELRNGNEDGWHSACVKSFFGTTKFPDIDVSKETLNQIALDTTGKGFTVPGVQKKLSLHLSKEEDPRLTLVNYPTGYILKPQTDEYYTQNSSADMEYLVLRNNAQQFCHDGHMKHCTIRLAVSLPSTVAMLLHT